MLMVSGKAEEKSPLEKCGRARSTHSDTALLAGARRFWKPQPNQVFFRLAKLAFFPQTCRGKFRCGL